MLKKTVVGSCASILQKKHVGDLACAAAGVLLVRGPAAHAGRYLRTRLHCADTTVSMVFLASGPRRLRAAPSSLALAALLLLLASFMLDGASATEHTKRKLPFDGDGAGDGAGDGSGDGSGNSGDAEAAGDSEAERQTKCARTDGGAAAAPASGALVAFQDCAAQMLSGAEPTQTTFGAAAAPDSGAQTNQTTGGVPGAANTETAENAAQDSGVPGAANTETADGSASGNPAGNGGSSDDDVILVEDGSSAPQPAATAANATSGKGKDAADQTAADLSVGSEVEPNPADKQDTDRSERESEDERVEGASCPTGGSRGRGGAPRGAVFGARGAVFGGRGRGRGARGRGARGGVHGSYTLRSVTEAHEGKYKGSIGLKVGDVVLFYRTEGCRAGTFAMIVNINPRGRYDLVLLSGVQFAAEMDVTPDTEDNDAIMYNMPKSRIRRLSQDLWDLCEKERLGYEREGNPWPTLTALRKRWAYANRNSVTDRAILAGSASASRTRALSIGGRGRGKSKANARRVDLSHDAGSDDDSDDPDVHAGAAPDAAPRAAGGAAGGAPRAAGGAAGGAAPRDAGGAAGGAAPRDAGGAARGAARGAAAGPAFLREQSYYQNTLLHQLRNRHENDRTELDNDRTVLTGAFFRPKDIAILHNTYRVVVLNIHDEQNAQMQYHIMYLRDINRPGHEHDYFTVSHSMLMTAGMQDLLETFNEITAGTIPALSQVVRTYEDWEQQSSEAEEGESTAAGAAGAAGPVDAAMSSMDGKALKLARSIENVVGEQLTSMAQALVVALERNGSHQATRDSATQRELSAAQRELEQLRPRVQELTARNAELERRQSQLESQNEAVEERITVVESERTVLQQRIAELESESTVLQQTIAEHNARSEELKKTLQTLHTNAQTTETRINDMLQSATDSAEMQQNLDAALQRQNDLAGEIAGLKAEVRKIAALNTELSARLVVVNDRNRALIAENRARAQHEAQQHDDVACQDCQLALRSFEAAQAAQEAPAQEAPAQAAQAAQEASEHAGQEEGLKTPVTGGGHYGSPEPDMWGDDSSEAGSQYSDNIREALLGRQEDHQEDFAAAAGGAAGPHTVPVAAEGAAGPAPYQHPAIAAQQRHEAWFAAAGAEGADSMPDAAGAAGGDHDMPDAAGAGGDQDMSDAAGAVAETRQLYPSMVTHVVRVARRPLYPSMVTYFVPVARPAEPAASEAAAEPAASNASAAGGAYVGVFAP